MIKMPSRNEKQKDAHKAKIKRLQIRLPAGGKRAGGSRIMVQEPFKVNYYDDAAHGSNNNNNK